MKVNVPIIYIVPGMVVADDVLTDSGQIICKKHSKIVRTASLEQLTKHGYKYLSIERDSIPADYLEKITNGSTTASVIQSEDFIEFQNLYDIQTEKAKQLIVEISNEQAVNTRKIYKTAIASIENISFKSSIFNYLDYIRIKDDYTYQHSINVSIIANVFAGWLNLSQEETMYLTVSGMLHDVGKTKIDPNVLNKAGKLTPEEFDLIKAHSKLGFDLIRRQNIPSRIKDAVLMHHEKIDGKGYPYGLLDLQIEPFAKIISICDIYDAMTSNRVYRGKHCPFEVIKTFETNSFGQLDTSYLLIFLKNIAYMYLGVKVLLSTKEEAEVVFINNNNLSRPIVRTASNEILDLSYKKDIYIHSLI